MTRTVSATTTTATGADVTQPIYLIYMAWDAVSPDVDRYVATWNQAITWNSINWQASGIVVGQLNANGGQISLPNGDNDPWKNLVSTQDQRRRAISIYEHHTDFSVSPNVDDATLLFTGEMNGCVIKDRGIQIDLIESRKHKHFPVGSINSEEYPHLLQPGQRLYSGPDVVLVKP